MRSIWRTLYRNISNLLLALALSIAVWITAISDADPTEEGIFPRSISIEFVGKDPSLVLIGEAPKQVSITMSAPGSIWERLINDPAAVRALVDLSQLGSGEHEVPVQIQVSSGPVRVVSYLPASVTIQLDTINTLDFPIYLVVKGDPAIGYQAEPAILDKETVSVTGPSIYLAQVDKVHAILDIEGTFENIYRAVSLTAVDVEGRAVENLSILPAQINVTQEVKPLGGYRNVVVKVVTSGQVVSGYRVTNISVFPPAVTVFSDDPGLVEELPGYVETKPLDLSGVKDDLDLLVDLILPPGVTLVGDQEVNVQVGIAAIEGSITLENMPVEVAGLQEGLNAQISPEMVDVILSGPLPILDTLRTSDIRIVVNLENLEAGVYQRIPQIEIELPDLRVQSILPGSLEVTITFSLTPTPAATPTGQVGYIPENAARMSHQNPGKYFS